MNKLPSTLSLLCIFALIFLKISKSKKTQDGSKHLSWWMAQTPIRIENICLTLQCFPDQPNVWLAKVNHCYVISQMSLYVLSVIRTYNTVKILCFFVSCNKKSHLLLCHRIYITWCFSTVLHPSYLYLCWRVRVKKGKIDLLLGWGTL